MAGTIIYCFNVPSLPFSCDFEVFPAKPPWFCDQDLSFFRLRLSFRVSTKIDYPDDYMPCALSILLRIPLIGFAPLKHVGIEELLNDESCLTHLEQLQGLATLLAFIALQPLRPYFMPVALMGFPLRSFLPKLKPKTLTGLLLPCGSFPKQLPDSFEPDEWMRTHASKFYSSAFAVFSMRGIKSHQKPYAPLRLSPLGLSPE
jgi:hypothetical protein